MTDNVRAGFTIIESMLFLAISALVFIVGFSGIGARLEQVRYTDSVRGLESDVETVFRTTNDGVNIRPEGLSCDVSGPAANVTSSSPTVVGQQPRCTVAGVDIIFDRSSSGEFSAVPLAVVTGQLSGSEFNFFSPEQINDTSFDIEPYLINADRVAGVNEVYDLLWGLEYVGYMSSGSINMNDITVRYIRSPISAQTFTYSGQLGSLSKVTNPLHLCFEDQNDRSATLTFLSNSTIKVGFLDGECS